MPSSQPKKLEAVGELHFDGFGIDAIRSQLSLAGKMSYFRYVRASGRSLSFLLLAILTIGTKCGEAHDRIYALWNLSNDCESLPIKLDYSESTAEMYMEFVEAYATTQQSLDVICATQVPIAGSVSGQPPSQILCSVWIVQIFKIRGLTQSSLEHSIYPRNSRS